MRTRMSGHVAGESGRPLPLCRFATAPCAESVESLIVVAYARPQSLLAGIAVRPPSRCETKEKRNMNYKNACIIGLLAVCLVLAGAVVAQHSNIDPSQHPSLAEAQQHIQEATKKIHEAHERDKS